MLWHSRQQAAGCKGAGRKQIGEHLNRAAGDCSYQPCFNHTTTATHKLTGLRVNQQRKRGRGKAAGAALHHRCSTCVLWVQGAEVAA